MGHMYKPILGIKGENVVVKQVNLVSPIPCMAMWHWSAVRVPDKFRRAHKGSDSKLVSRTRMIPVLLVYLGLEVSDG